MSAPSWLHAEDDLYAPHSITWRDLNADSIPDLMFLSGEEEVVADGIPELIDPARPVIELATDGACPGLSVPPALQSSEDWLYDLPAGRLRESGG